MTVLYIVLVDQWARAYSRTALTQSGINVINQYTQNNKSASAHLEWSQIARMPEY